MHTLGPCGSLQQTSPVRLGVPPAAAPTPMGAFNQRFEALFPRAGALGYSVCSAPLCSSRFICVRMWGQGVLSTALPAPFSATLSQAFLVYLCMNVGPQGLPVVGLPAPLVPHSTSLGPTIATRVLLAQVPISAPPTGLDVCFFFIYLVSDFLAIQFSVSSGCVRRRSVSTLRRHLGSPIFIFEYINYYFTYCFFQYHLSPLFPLPPAPTPSPHNYCCLYP